jgi:hypothetical protein
MLPDYPHKVFTDKRSNYSLLMETLAMEAIQLVKGGLRMFCFVLV